MIDKSVALVTGASQGIGRAIALKFAEEGFAVALTARNESALQETAKLIEEAGSFKPYVAPADLRDLQQITKLADSVYKKWGRIDVLVNNAGILHLKPFLEITPEEWQEMLDVNIKAVFELTQKVVPEMIARKSGAIVNIASLGGKNGFKSGTGYSATKYALRGFAASLMMELREYDIRVITVFPGSVATREAGRRADSPTRESMWQPEDVAHAVYAAVSVDSRAMMSEIDIRPSNPKRT